MHLISRLYVRKNGRADIRSWMWLYHYSFNTNYVVIKYFYITIFERKITFWGYRIIYEITLNITFESLCLTMLTTYKEYCL